MGEDLRIEYAVTYYTNHILFIFYRLCVWYQQIMMVEYQLFIYTCNSTARDVTLGVLYGYNILLHLATVVIAFKTRKFKVKVLNDYREIILATCISGFVLVLILVFTYTVTDQINLYSALTSFGLFVAATAIMVLVFVPKVTNDQQLLLF